MAYADVEWTDTTTAALADIQTMLSNLDHLRAEADYRILAASATDGTGGAAASAIAGGTGDSTGDALFAIKVGALGGLGVWETPAFAPGGDQDVALSNLDISGLPDWQLFDVAVEGWGRLGFSYGRYFLGNVVLAKLWKTPEDSRLHLVGSGRGSARTAYYGGFADRYLLLQLQRFSLFTTRDLVASSPSS